MNTRDWTKTVLGQVLTLHNGRAYAQPELLERGPYKVVRIQNLKGGCAWYHSDLELDENKYCLPGDLLFAWSASFGPFWWRDPKAIFHYHIWRVDTSPALDCEFAYYLLDSITAAVKARSHGGLGMLHMTKSGMETWPVVLPPVPEQRKIAAILSSVDDAIETTQAVIDQLQVVKKAMMAELLTHGLPGRYTKFKMTEIGEVPEEWEVVGLGTIGQWLSGGTPSKQDPDLWSGPVPWVSPKDMKRPRIDDAIDHVSHEALQRGTQLAPVGSVLMVVRGMILAHTFPVAVTTGSVAFNQDIKALVPNNDFESEFVMFWLQERGEEILHLTDVSNHGTKRLPSERLFASKIPKPPIQEQKTIVAVLQSFDARMASERAARDQLRKTKTALMAVLLTGEVRVTPNEESA